MRAHVALSSAVNQVLDGAAGSGTQGTLVSGGATSFVEQLQEALKPSAKLMRALRDTLDTSLAGITRQLGDMDQTNPNLKPIQDSLATRQETMVTVTDKSLEETRVQLAKVELWCEKLGTSLGAHQELVDLLSTLKFMGDRNKEHLERVELVFATRPPLSRRSWRC